MHMSCSHLISLGTIIATPKAGSLQTVLQQALHTHDHALLEYVLCTTKPSIIRNTVERLNPTMILPLFDAIVTRLESTPARGASLAIWISTIITCHTSYLLSIPNLASSLTKLHSLIDTRITSFRKLYKLSGRLDLLISPARGKKQKFKTKPKKQNNILKKNATAATEWCRPCTIWCGASTPKMIRFNIRSTE